jgi:hypothetical protein
LPREDLFGICTLYEFGYRHTTGTAALFYMIGALSRHGKVSLTCIGNIAAEAQAHFERTETVLDDKSNGDGRGEPVPLFERYPTI